MFSLDDLRSLLNARPFVPFRLWLSDGGHVDVRSRELVLLGRRFALIGLLDPEAKDTAFDRYSTIWYLHVTRHEMLSAGPPPFSPTSGPSEAPSPTPA